jgi:hypothetical protein
VRIARDDVEQDERGAARTTVAMFSMAQRRDREPEAPGELRLRHAQALAHACDVDGRWSEFVVGGVRLDLLERLGQSRRIGGRNFFSPPR